MIRVLVFVVLGILMTLGLNHLDVPEWLKVVLFITAAIIMAISGVWVEEKWQNRLKSGDRVSATLNSGNIYVGVVTGRCWIVPIIITVTLDELPEIPNVSFYGNELRRIP